MTVLRGPADADHYRVKVGRTGDRHYTDPLPSCPIAEASDWVGPAWSTVKKAAGKDWSYVTNKRNGHASRTELTRISHMEEADDRTAAFNAINKAGLSQAGGRGTIVHLWAEDLLAGRSPRTITEPVLFALKLPKAALAEALTYLPALQAFFDHYQPEVIAAEYVALHRTLNGHGYGCTPDVIALIQGAVANIDWKTRGADSDHGCYPEEAAQASAGAKAQYMIVTDPDGYPVRAPIPKVDCGLIVSIKPDGCRIYPTDIDKGFQHLEAMLAFWVARLTEKAAVGKPWPPTPISDTAASVSEATGADQRPSSAPVAQPASSTPISDDAPSGTSEATGARPSATRPAAPVAAPAPNPQEDLWTTTTADRSPDHTTTQPTPTTTSGTTRGTNTKTASSQHTATTASTTTPTETTASTTTAAASSNADAPTDFGYTSRVLARAMQDWPQTVRDELAEWWPNGCPTPAAVLHNDDTWTEQQIDHLQQMCDLADAPWWQTAAPQTRTR